MTKTIIGTYFKTWNGAYNYWVKQERVFGKEKFAIIHSKKPRGYLVVSRRQLT